MSKIRTQLACQIFKNREKVNAWFATQFKENPPPFYCSVDIRDSGEKIAPVDSNLFPAGFNNICEVDFENASKLFKVQMQEYASVLNISVPKKLLIIPESHTENKFYIENLYCLKTILEEADFEVEIGWFNSLSQEMKEPLKLVSEHEHILNAYPLQISSTGALTTSAGYEPDWIILNNDFSQGYPKVLDSVKQPIFPSYKLGWHKRTKSTHFVHYNTLATEFAKLIEVDPWLITIASEAVGPVNFNEGVGIDQVIKVADQMFATLKDQFAQHKVKREPALFIKNNSGTYGMGIMVIHSTEELRTMNRRTKNKMSMGKNKSVIHEVVIQEGVPTHLTVDGATSEPVIYMMGHELIGGFIRANKERDDLDNLNSQGMIFKKLCFKDLHDSWDCGKLKEFPELESTYGTIAKISALAAAKELKDIR